MQGGKSPLTDWINSDVKTANTVSIIIIIFAAWAGIEAITNVAGIEIPPETGMATNIDPDDTQRTNNGVIIGLGAVLGTVGVIIQVLIPRGTIEEEVEDKGPVFDEDLIKLTKWLCSRGTTTAEFFEWADVDGSGSIDMVELANALRAAEIANLPPWEIEDLVKIMDINSDGRIDLPELDITLLNIRNTLGIEFIPYVEEETIPEVVEQEGIESEEAYDTDVGVKEETEPEEAVEEAELELPEEESGKSEEGQEAEDAGEPDAKEQSELDDADEEVSESEEVHEEASESEEAGDADGEVEQETESEKAEEVHEEASESEEAGDADGEVEQETESEEAVQDAGPDVPEEESSESEEADDADVEVEEEIPKKKKKF